MEGGTPFLKPQISNKLILSYVWNSLSLNLSYSKLDDYFTSITDALGTTKTVMTTKNIGAQQQVGAGGTLLQAPYPVVGLQCKFRLVLLRE